MRLRALLGPRAAAGVRTGGPLGARGAAPTAVRIAPRGASGSGRRPFRRGQVARALLGGALLVAGLALALGAGPAAQPGRAILVASRTLAPGTTLVAADLRSARLAAPAGLLATLVPSADEADALRRVLVAPLLAGEPLVRPALAGSTPAAFTLTVGAQHALGGSLEPGDRVSVLATFQGSNGGAVTRTLARGLLVLAVGAPPSLGDPSEETVPITVALPDPRLASGLALANTVGHIDLLRDGALAGSIPAASIAGVEP